MTDYDFVMSDLGVIQTPIDDEKSQSEFKQKENAQLEQLRTP